MVNHVIDSESVQHYGYEGKEYSIKLYYLENQPIKAFVSFQMDIKNDCDDIVGFGEDHHDKNNAIIKAIKHLHSQLNDEVDVEKAKAEELAKRFLTEQGLLD